MVKIMVITSPTGGHFYPAISVSKELLKLGHEIIFVTQKGTKFLKLISDELQTVPYKDRIKIETISAPKFLRNAITQLCFFLVLLILSFIQCIRLLVIYNPRIIFSTGGYTSFPMVISAKILFPWKKIVLHEQNYVFGLTNKILKLFATKVCLSFPSKYKNTKKYIYTKTPLRENFNKEIDKSQCFKKFGFDSTKFTMLIFGGSQGARSINNAIVKILKSHEEKFTQVQILHITGTKDFDKITEEYKSIKIKKVVLPYLYEMELAYTIADLVISRAGAMTVAELIFFNKPAILIPLPTAAEFHQNWNAEYLSRHGCAKVIYETYEWEERLYSELIKFIFDKELLQQYSLNYQKLPSPRYTISEIILKS